MSYLIKKRKSNNNKVLVDGEPVTLDFENVKLIKNKYVAITKKDIGQVLAVEDNVINLMGEEYQIVSSISVGENGVILLKCDGGSFSQVPGDCTIILSHVSFIELHIFFHWKVESFTEKNYFIDDEEESDTEDEMIEPDLECLKDEYVTRLSKEVADLEDTVADKRKLVDAIRQTVDFQKLQNIIDGVEGL